MSDAEETDTEETDVEEEQTYNFKVVLAEDGYVGTVHLYNINGKGASLVPHTRIEFQLKKTKEPHHNWALHVWLKFLEDANGSEVDEDETEEDDTYNNRRAHKLLQFFKFEVYGKLLSEQKITDAVQNTFALKEKPHYAAFCFPQGVYQYIREINFVAAMSANYPDYVRFSPLRFSTLKRMFNPDLPDHVGNSLRAQDQAALKQHQQQVAFIDYMEKDRCAQLIKHTAMKVGTSHAGNFDAKVKKVDAKIAKLVYLCATGQRFLGSVDQRHIAELKTSLCRRTAKALQAKQNRYGLIRPDKHMNMRFEIVFYTKELENEIERLKARLVPRKDRGPQSDEDSESSESESSDTNRGLESIDEKVKKTEESSSEPGSGDNADIEPGSGDDAETEPARRKAEAEAALQAAKKKRDAAAKAANDAKRKAEAAELAARQKRWEKVCKPYKYLALVNNGNTCFANSVIQALLRVPLIRTALENVYKQCKQVKEDKSVLCTLADVWKQQQAAPKNGEDNQPANIKKVTCDNIQSYAGGNFVPGHHQDAHDYLTHLLVKLVADSEKLGQSQPFDSAFSGQTTASTKCPTCTTHSDKRDLVKGLSVSISGQRNTVLDYIKHQYINAVRAEPGNYPVCQATANGNACGATIEQRTLNIAIWPDVLVVQLKRFTVEADHTIKSVEKVNIDEEFDTSDLYGNNKTRPTAPASVNHRKYVLSSVVVHAGKSVRRGHYYTFGKRGDDWFEFNDLNVCSLADAAGKKRVSGVLDGTNYIGNEVPYLLFYAAVDGDDQHADVPPASDGRADDEEDLHVVELPPLSPQSKASRDAENKQKLAEFEANRVKNAQQRDAEKAKQAELKAKREAAKAARKAAKAAKKAATKPTRRSTRNKRGKRP